MNNLQDLISECNKSAGGQEVWRLRMSLGKGTVATWKHFIQKTSDADFLRALILIEKFNTTKPRSAILTAAEKQLALIGEN